MDINKEVIEGKFDIIERNLRFLEEEFKEVSPDIFIKSYKDVQAAKYSLLEIMEACIDIANHIISVRGYRRANDYSDMFEVLKEENIIDSLLAEKMENMARFRNLLVHKYGKVDNRRVLEIIKFDLEDIKHFEKEIEKLLTS